MKGVILAGGLGTRLFPLTKITNKHLLPVYDRPMIHYPLKTLADAGIKDILIVTGGNHAGEFLRLLGNGKEYALNEIAYAYQEGEGGIADALSLARPFAKGDRIVVMLGDNIIEGDIRRSVSAFAQQAAGARILLKKVPDRLQAVGAVGECPLADRLHLSRRVPGRETQEPLDHPDALHPALGEDRLGPECRLWAYVRHPAQQVARAALDAGDLLARQVALKRAEASRPDPDVAGDEIESLREDAGHARNAAARHHKRQVERMKMMNVEFFQHCPRLREDAQISPEAVSEIKCPQSEPFRFVNEDAVRFAESQRHFAASHFTQTVTKAYDAFFLPADAVMIEQMNDFHPGP